MIFFLRETVLDSWAKFPSGIMSGNTFEFGEFTQCLHIQRNDEQYKTRYCLAQLTVDVGNLSLASTSGQFRMRDVNIPNILFTGEDDDEENSLIGARIGFAP